MYWSPTAGDTPIYYPETTSYGVTPMIVTSGDNQNFEKSSTRNDVVVSELYQKSACKPGVLEPVYDATWFAKLPNCARCGERTAASKPCWKCAQHQTMQVSSPSASDPSDWSQRQPVAWLDWGGLNVAAVKRYSSTYADEYDSEGSVVSEQGSYAEGFHWCGCIPCRREKTGRIARFVADGSMVFEPRVDHCRPVFGVPMIEEAGFEDDIDGTQATDSSTKEDELHASTWSPRVNHSEKKNDMAPVSGHLAVSNADDGIENAGAVDEPSSPASKTQTDSIRASRSSASVGDSQGDASSKTDGDQVNPKPSTSLNTSWSNYRRPYFEDVPEEEEEEEEEGDSNLTSAVGAVLLDTPTEFR